MSPLMVRIHAARLWLARDMTKPEFYLKNMGLPVG